ncbi:MAG: 30S ribosomal protein S6 [Spirochaetales bacterium]|nr:30S ribosomal protein S6 [Spirochaetales bacterium]
MRKYEAIFIFRPEENNLAQGKAAVQTEFKNSGINIIKENDMGLKTLAYDIKKNDKGHYINFEIESEPDKIKPLDKIFKLNNEILKFVFFKKEK